MASRSFPDLTRPVYDIVGLPFDAIDLGQAVDQVLACVDRRDPLFISTPNLNFLIAAQADAGFRRSVHISDLSLADGMPIVWLARLLGVPIRQRVAGSDLFEALCEQDRRTVRVFFFGGPEGAAQQAGERVNRLARQKMERGQTPGVECVGFESPGFGSLDEMSQPDLIARINACHADFIVVALGARKGQAWIERNRELLDAPVISHLGAVVNMAAGTIARAPRWMQVLGLEWIWRIKEEPMLWRRYGSDGLALLRLLALRITPQVWRRGLRALGLGRSSAPARCDVRQIDGADQLVLEGDWTHDSLGTLRTAISEGVKRGVAGARAGGAGYIDPAVQGLLDISWPVGPQTGGLKLPASPAT